MTVLEINEVVEQFAFAAALAVASGFDGAIRGR
jgi:2,4-dienoyl-CoA reductase-like NADH-dependent reductase (Old Yellow Enzyme family)